MSLAVIAFFMGCGFIWYVIWYVHEGVFSASTSDASAWLAVQTNKTESTCYRGGMANDVKNRLLAKGMSQLDVQNFLGVPDSHSSFEYQYVLGMCSGIGVDYDNLHVYFDEQGRLTRTLIAQH